MQIKKTLSYNMDLAGFIKFKQRKITIKRFLKLFFIFFLTFPVFCFSEKKREDLPAVVNIEIKTGSGTAFFISPQILITNFHVIESITAIEDVHFQSPREEKVQIEEILALSAINDLAVLKVKDYRSKHYYSLDHSIGSAREGETAGFSDGRFQQSYGQRLPSPGRDNTQLFIFQKTIGAGASGSPIFTGRKLIAILEGHVQNSNMALAVPVNSLRELLSKPFIHCKSKICIENEINKIHQEAEQGNAEAQYRLGTKYSLGRGAFTLDLKKGFDWIKKAAEQGHLMAQHGLARRYWKGLGTDKDFNKAFELFKKLAEQDKFIPSQHLLALLYRDNDGTKQDSKKAFEIFSELSEKYDFIPSQYVLAEMHLKGLGTEQNFNKAFGWYKNLAGRGFEPAQYALAKMHLNGQGTEQNFNKAFELFNNLAEQGFAPAQYQLFLMYSEGQGTEKDSEKAFEYLVESALQSHPKAQIHLNWLYLKKMSPQ